MAEGVYGEEVHVEEPQPSVEPALELTPEMIDGLRLLTAKLISGEVIPEEIPFSRVMLILYLEEALAWAQGAQRGTVLNMIQRVRDLPVEEGDPAEELSRFVA
jgi:hypothetical protein